MTVSFKRKTSTISLLAVVLGSVFVFICSTYLIYRCEKYKINKSLNILFESGFSSSDTLDDLQSLVTTVECIGSLYNQSCLYKNLYYGNRNFWALSLEANNLSLPGVRREAFAPEEYYPQHRVFKTFKELHNFVRFETDPVVFSGLTVHFNARWHENIGHALFDGLYSAYVSLIRFAPRHLYAFRIFAGFGNSHCDYCLGEDIYKRFAGIGMIKTNVINSMIPKNWFLFEELLMASEMMCQRCIQPNYQLGGGVELEASRLFRERMYKQHGIISPHARKKHSAEGRNPKRPLKAFIIHNKRFLKQEIQELKSAIEEINNYTNMHISKNVDEIKKLPYPLINVTYIDYRNIHTHSEVVSQTKVVPVDSKSIVHQLVNNKFMSQLKVLRDMDIYVTGPGTGQMYQTFIPDGSVVINVGGMNPRLKPTAHNAYPSYLEQYVTAGTPYVKGIYYPINKRARGIKKTEVMKLIQQAANSIMKGFSIPVNPNNNLAPDGKVFVELCANDPDFCRLVTVRKEGSYWCNNIWVEDLVYERQQWSASGHIIEGRNWTCPFNRSLMRTLRQKYDIAYHPD